MGKSKELNENIKYYSSEDDFEDIEKDIEKEEEEERKMINTVIEINEGLIKHSQENGYSLCEYLDYNMTKQYLEWLLKR
jgi:t-SNARE complex subunit (syntaxin)